MYGWPPVLFCLDSAALLMLNEQQFYLFFQIQTSQTGVQQYNDAILKNGHLRPLFHLFSIFTNKQYIFYSKLMWKMSIQYSNPQPDYESSPITTRPGLPPHTVILPLTKQVSILWVTYECRLRAVWLDGYIIIAIFGHLQQWTFAKKHNNWPK